jgi:hypothetical protein
MAMMNTAIRSFRGADERPLLAYAALSAIGAAIALVAWYPGHYLIALLLLPYAWAKTENRRHAFILWGSYFAVVLRDFALMAEHYIAGAGRMSASSAFCVGAAATMILSALLASPFVLLAQRARKTTFSWRAVLASVVVTLPPIGIFGMGSPLHVSSALFPGLAGYGVGLSLAAIGVAAASPGPLRVMGFLILGCIAMFANATYVDRVPPQGWVALRTRFGQQSGEGYLALYKRAVDVQEAAQAAFASGATTVITPEEVAGPWRASSQFWWASLASNLRITKRTLLLGVETFTDESPDHVRFYDTLVAIGNAKGQFESRQPAPGGTWRPWAPVSSNLGALDQPYLVINGLRTAVSICYEDALLWPHWRMLFDRPDVIVSVANNWFNSSLYDAQAQRQSIESVARLVGRPLLRAVNE